MVFDKLENSAQYAAIHPRLAKAFEYLHTADLGQLALGRHDIDGDQIFALVQEYRTRPDNEGFWESHRQYIDVQHVASGAERMGYANIDRLKVRQEYDADKDVAIYDGQGDFFVVGAGMFTIFQPQDGHMPCLSPGEATTVRKVVIKVAV
ncbi:MAG TPA: YhcH/YjgK/YiaL family protein [Pirellulales bacterium]|nr:YhcH/YjgK/YiaL family protein [Pirellulales bacterium]